MVKRKRFIVVGGGIAGLAAGYYLQQLAGKRGLPISLHILESDSRFGGKILTERRDGFVIEGGPDTFVATKPWAMALCSGLGIQDRLHGTNPRFRTTYILRDGRLHPLPGGLTMMIPTDLGSMVTTGLLSWQGKARMALEFLLPPKRDPGEESMGGFVTRRLGREAYEQLIEPLLSGIYAGNGDELSLQATLPYLRDLEQRYGGLIRGALAARRSRRNNGSGASDPPSVFMTPRTGLAEIVEALVAKLLDSGAELRTGAEVCGLTSTAEEAQLRLCSGTTMSADGVVLATPSFITANLLRKLDPTLASELSGIQYASTATVTLGYREQRLARKLDGYGYVIPRREGREALACTWTSSKFPHRAPEGFALLRVFIGRAGQEAEIRWEKAELLKIALTELRTTLGIESEPEFGRVHIFERAMPQYNLGHPARLQRIEACLAKWPRLALAGAAYRGIGIPDCINSGKQAAERIISDTVGETADGAHPAEAGGIYAA
ncbi:MAG: protoporphyrinogen oxidase [Anaerolineae bacterium]|nr:MAG: protoporphyrinogen oxidase [Anaerolineae bacterium]